MDVPTRLKGTVAAAVVLAAGGILLSVLTRSHPLPLATLAVLAAIGLLSLVISVRLTEEGSAASVHYLPVLAAAVVAGPAGAVLVAVLSDGAVMAWRPRPPLKTVYNLAQQALAALAGGGTFVALGGAVGGTGTLAGQLFPFAAASLAYFLVNRTLVTGVVAAESGEPFPEVWRDLDGGMLPMDVAMSFLALMVAQLHGTWGAPGQLLLLLPVLGTRLGYVAEGKSRRASRDLLQLVVKSLEAQDPYTSGHSVRVARAARRLARELGLDAREVETVETAALLHDIGKIGVEYAEILTHEGRLTDEQYDLVREHPERGVEILESVESLDPRVLEHVLHHHERWDGKGYPAGLAGEEIPLGARIVGICDAVDAMGSRRSYRSALSASEIRLELRRCTGTQFDPRVVRAALELDLPGDLAAGAPDEEAAGERADGAPEPAPRSRAG